VEDSAASERQAGHCQREGEACDDADHGRLWSGTGTGMAQRQALSASKGTCGVGDDSRWEVGERFLRKRAGVVGPVARRPRKRGVRTNGCPEESITTFRMM
jgi:hypothetical protein